MPNEIKYESMIYKVHMVYKNAIYIYIYFKVLCWWANVKENYQDVASSNLEAFHQQNPNNNF